MIRIVVGGVGSGKTLSAIKDVVDRGVFTFTNFGLVGVKNYQRLKYSHIIEETAVEFKKDGSAKKMKTDVNFKFWEEQMKNRKGFDITIDELQSVANSRRSQSKENVAWQSFISQIRKLLGSSEKNHITLITQRPNSIDVQFRELAHVWVLCNKVMINQVEVMTETPEGKKMLPLVVVTRNYFRSLDELDAFNRFQNDSIPFYSDWFLGNKYFKYYNSYNIVDFRGEFI